MSIGAWAGVATISLTLLGGIIHILRVCLRIERGLWSLDVIRADFAEHEKMCREDKTRMWTRLGEVESRVTRVEARGHT